MSVRFVIFTDLDATLLDHRTYSFKPAKPVLEKVKKLKIPVVLCTSKTRAETEALTRELGLKHPFIVENGGAVFMPENYFPAAFFKKLGLKTVKNNGYRVVELGRPYRRLRQFFKLVRKNTSLPLIGFGDLTLDQVAALTGLGKKEAQRARLREYDEPFFLESSLLAKWLQTGKKNQALKRNEGTGSSRLKKNELISYKHWGPNDIRRVLRRIRQEASRYGLRITAGGRFYHLTGRNDKGQAVRLLCKLYRLKFGRIITIGLGDSANDWPLLEAVDYPVLVARPDGSHAKLPPGVKNIYKTRKPGPRGWAEAIKYFLSSFGISEGRAAISTVENKFKSAPNKKQKREKIKNL
ncbi:MAG: HAD-IIB family hydrolase [Candidatus Aminicenantes bacterium]|nr:HAD-IIB family hydrolase [Candidatus Aminicenantes bacterium]